MKEWKYLNCQRASKWTQLLKFPINEQVDMFKLPKSGQVDVPKLSKNEQVAVYMYAKEWISGFFAGNDSRDQLRVHAEYSTNTYRCKATQSIFVARKKEEKKRKKKWLSTHTLFVFKRPLIYAFTNNILCCKHEYIIIYNSHAFFVQLILYTIPQIKTYTWLHTRDLL